MQGIKISIINADALQVEADVLILKYAQASYGLDMKIVATFETLNCSIVKKLPKEWDYFVTDSKKITNTRNILFIGTPPLMHFGYKEIRQFGKLALSTLASCAADTKSLVLTIHGPGYGLDEMEAFKAQTAGIFDSLTAGDYPGNLQEITFVERSKERVERLEKALNSIFPAGYIFTSKSGLVTDINKGTAKILQSAGFNSEQKKSVFVAMPFASDFDDCFHYGISGAVNSCGYLCERADLQSFTGDVMSWVKGRISSADFVIADLTTANPNVYLEVGYAWGLNKKTILLVKNMSDLKFDTRSQRCLVYASIKDLETKLKSELTNLSF